MQITDLFAASGAASFFEITGDTLSIILIKACPAEFFNDYRWALVTRTSFVYASTFFKNSPPIKKPAIIAGSLIILIPGIGSFKQDTLDDNYLKIV